MKKIFIAALLGGLLARCAARKAVPAQVPAPLGAGCLAPPRRHRLFALGRDHGGAEAGDVVASAAQDAGMAHLEGYATGAHLTLVSRATFLALSRRRCN